MDGHPRSALRRAIGTELGLQTASLTPRADGASANPVAGAVLVLVGAEDVRRRAGVADRRRRLEVAQGDRHLAVGEQALDVVDALAARLDLDQAPERAALDAVRRQVDRRRAAAG